MKILHISTSFPLSFPGGITNYVRSLAGSQASKGHEVHVVAGVGTDISLVPQGVTVHSYYSSKVRPFMLTFYYKDEDSKKLYNRIKMENYDLIHFHMALDLDLTFFDAMSKSGIPYLVSLHDYFFICQRIFMVDYTGKNVCTKINYEKCCRCIGVFDQIELLERIVRRINRIYSGRQLIKLPRLKSNNVIYRNEFMIKFLESARVVLPVSNRVRNIFIEACPRANYQVEHIGNETANHISSTKTDSRKIRVGFIGVLNYMKGAEVLRSFLFNVKRTDMEFHFYGRADSLYQLTLTELGLNFHGSYNPSDLADIMSKIDIGLVLPVWEDNGPQVVMEFLNSGTPVLGTKRGGIIDFINTDNGMLFEPNTPEGINDAVQWLQTITHEKIRSLIKSIVPTITPEEHMQRMYEIYNNALRNTSIT